MYVCVNMCHVNAGASGSHRASGPLELELKVFVTCLIWVLETKFQSAGRVASAACSSNGWAVSPAPSIAFKRQ